MKSSEYLERDAYEAKSCAHEDQEEGCRDICGNCNGSGEGLHEGDNCYICKGKGEV